MLEAREIVAALLETDPDDISVKHYIDAAHRENTSGKVTPHAAMTASTFYHRTLKYKRKGGGPLEVRRNGRTKTWKTRPGQFQVPVKYGFRECFYIDNRNAHEWSTIPDPPPEPAT